MAKTLVDVDRNLLDQAKTLLGQPTLTATINEALRQVVARHALTTLTAYLTDLDEDQHTALEGARDQW